MADKINVVEINNILLNSMPNSWCKQASVLRFYCESTLILKYVNMFQRMEIAESIYEGVVTPSYKKYSGRCQLYGIQQGKESIIRLVKYSPPRLMGALASAVKKYVD